jgi:hypothetical protein
VNVQYYRLSKEKNEATTRKQIYQRREYLLAIVHFGWDDNNARFIASKLESLPSSSSSFLSSKPTDLFAFIRWVVFRCSVGNDVRNHTIPHSTCGKRVNDKHERHLIGNGGD